MGQLAKYSKRRNIIHLDLVADPVAPETLAGLVIRLAPCLVNVKEKNHTQNYHGLLPPSQRRLCMARENRKTLEL